MPERVGAVGGFLNISEEQEQMYRSRKCYDYFCVTVNVQETRIQYEDRVGQ